MKYCIMFLGLCVLSLLIGCGKEVDASPISKPGVENIITEHVMVEETIEEVTFR